jgi:hypothetical protein
MRISSLVRAALIALVPLTGFATPGHADSGTVILTIYKAGWIMVF